MSQHWRRTREQAPEGDRPSPLIEFLRLFLGVFQAEGDNERWMPFDPSPSSLRRRTPKSES